MTNQHFSGQKFDKTVIYATFFLFTLLTLWGIQHHEPWRDEFHSAMIAYKGQSLSHLMALKAYEGHPALWYILLHYLWQITDDWSAMLWLNWSIAVAAVWLLLRHAPMPLWMRVGIVLGYFFIFEYTILARNYAIELLFIFWVGILLPYRQKNIGLLGIVLCLALLMQTNIYGLMIGGLLAVFFIWELWLPLLL